MRAELVRNENELNKRTQAVIPPVDIYETEGDYVIVADMPGVSKENVEVNLENGVLEILGHAAEKDEAQNHLKYREYRLYDYRRTFNVGGDVNEAGITAKAENGVLTVTLPKREEAKPRKIEITAH